MSCSEGNSLLPEENIEQISQLISQAQSLKDHNSDSAFLLAQEALIYSQGENFEKGIASSSLILGEICYEKGEYKRASAYLVASVRIFEKTNDAAALGKSYNLIGRIFQYNDRFDLARLNYEKALRVFDVLEDTTGIAQTYGNLGHLNEKNQAYDSAIYYNLLAKSLYEKSADSTGIATIYDNIGSVYEDLENYNEAKKHFLMAYNINSKLGNEVEAIINYNNVADTYRKTRSYSEALEIYEEVLQESKRLNQTYQLRSAYRDLSRTYFPLGNFEIAYLYLDSCYAVADQLASQEIARGIEETRSIYELEQKQRQIEILEKNKRLSLVIRTALILLSALLVVIGLLIFTQLKTRIKKEEAEKKLAQVKQDQLATDLNLKKLREEKMYQELENMSKELTSNVLNIIRKNKFLTQLRKELKKMKSSKDEGTNKAIKKVIRSINYNFSLDDDWQEFETVFQQVHMKFFEQLRKDYPDLTSAETRLCAMMRLNLDSKDMATIMGISQDSLRIARYRLRKKLGIDKGANLYSFMMNIG
ncbi:MAG: tetratricopeptide repeat protein [Bacteroidota bacterium]